MIGTLEVGWIASTQAASFFRFIFAIRAIFVAVTNPTFHQTTAITASELVARARTKFAISLVALVFAVCFSIAHVNQRNTFRGRFTLKLHQKGRINISTLVLELKKGQKQAHT